LNPWYITAHRSERKNEKILRRGETQMRETRSVEEGGLIDRQIKEARLRWESSKGERRLGSRAVLVFNDERLRCEGCL